MTCNDMDRVLNSRRGDAPLPPEAADHIAGCERCLRLMRVLGTAADIPAPSLDRLKQIQSMMLQDLKPVKPLASRSVILAGLAISFGLVAVVGILLLHPNGWRLLTSLQKLVVTVSLALGTVALAVSLVQQMRPGSRYAVPPSLLPAAVLLSLAIAIAAVFQSQEEQSFVLTGLRCLAVGMMYALPGGALSWLWLRRGAVLDPKLTGATAGAFAALIGIAVLEAHCPNLNRNHILVWHLGVLILCTILGIGLGAIAEARDRQRPSVF